MEPSYFLGFTQVQQKTRPEFDEAKSQATMADTSDQGQAFQAAFQETAAKNFEAYIQPVVAWQAIALEIVDLMAQA